MSETASPTLLPNAAGSEQDTTSVEKATTPGGDREVKWEVVARTAGLMPAEIIAGRLQAEGIPARAWQEGAGQAFGLTVGLLGTGYVIVPEVHLEQARALLDKPDAAALHDEALDEWEDEVSGEASGEVTDEATDEVSTQD